ncbi:MAG: tetratricopeptide repeat protein [Candidatus Omnitrophota bacterium]|jgi:hypothetical protein
MKKIILLSIIVIVLVAAIGCQQASSMTGAAATSSAAIETSKSMPSSQQKIDYLITQARSFYESKKFQDAVNTAQYVLSALDKNSADAKSLLEKAKQQLQAAVQSRVTDVKKGLGGIVK